MIARVKVNGVQWKPIPGFPLYEASEFGRVRRSLKSTAITCTKPGRVLRLQKAPSNKNCGHYSLRKGGRTFNIRAGNIVLITFCKPKPSKRHECCHKNDDANNNHYTNLYWGTRKQNMRDAIKNGRTTKGSKNTSAKLTEIQVAEIKKSTDKSNKLAQRFLVSEATISRIKANKIWRHV